jgi:hypothetical protein
LPFSHAFKQAVLPPGMRDSALQAREPSSHLVWVEFDVWRTKVVLILRNGSPRKRIAARPEVAAANPILHLNRRRRTRDWGVPLPKFNPAKPNSEPRCN